MKKTAKSQPNLKELVDRTPLTDAARERMHVAATVTQEKAWPVSEPNQGLARMFVIMLLVHVVIIGGIIIYDFVSEPADNQIKVSNKPSTTSKNTAPAPLPNVAGTPAEPSSQGASAAPAAAAIVSAASQPTAAPASVPAPPRATIVEAAPSSVERITTSEPAPQKVTATPVIKENPLPAPSLIPSNLTSSNMTVVDLPPAPVPDVKSQPIVPPPPPAARSASEPPKPAKATQSARTDSTPPATDSRRAVPVAAKELKPVPTPSDARRELREDRTPAPAPKKTTTSTPPAPKKAAETKAPATARTKTPEPAKATPKAAAKATTSKASGSKHTVGKGETIYSIARKYKITEEALMRMNGIKNPNSLQIGKTLIIP